MLEKLRIWNTHVISPHRGTPVGRLRGSRTGYRSRWVAVWQGPRVRGPSSGPCTSSSRTPPAKYTLCIYDLVLLCKGKLGDISEYKMQTQMRPCIKIKCAVAGFVYVCMLPLLYRETVWAVPPLYPRVLYAGSVHLYTYSTIKQHKSRIRIRYLMCGS